MYGHIAIFCKICEELYHPEEKVEDPSRWICDKCKKRLFPEKEGE
jgi:hypothetical protein